MDDAEAYDSTFVNEFYGKEIITFSELIGIMSDILKQYILTFRDQTIIYIIISLFIFYEKMPIKIKGRAV